jgi:hypothetical protein
LLDGVVSVDTRDRGRFFQENHGFLTNSCSSPQIQWVVAPGVTGWIPNPISVGLVRFHSLLIPKFASRRTNLDRRGLTRFYDDVL